MTYPGNPSLSTAVKDRVVSTFRQTIALFQQGRTDEVVAGCNLLLQMDPMFDPAKKLLEKTRNPGLPIDVNTLLPPDPQASLQQAREAMVARDFQRVVNITTNILTDDLLNDDARILGDEARERMEAGPFVEQFARKCENHIAAGNLGAARTELDKARALDPTHPTIARVQLAIDAAEAEASRSGAPPSFIVDDSAQQATGRAAAPASDFGFTFEEEKTPAFSFDSPSDSSFANFSFGAPAAAAPAPPAGPPPGANDFDFATASISTSPDDQKKIDQYLADGDRAYDSGDYQQAIDLWSRIFLIDVTNDPASDRIEKAKGKRREIDQKVEPLLTQATDAFDRGDKAKARDLFGEALRIDPRNTTAQDYIDQIGDVAGGGPSNPYIPPTPSADKIDLDFFDEEPLGSITPLTPPPPAPAKASGKAAAQPKAAPAPARKLPVATLAVVLLGILLVGAGGWYAWQNFMNKPETATPAATEQIFARASALAARGKYDQAITLLQDVKPGDPQHDKALEMIADLQQKKSTAGNLVDGKTPDQLYEEKIVAAKTAFDAHDYAGAKAAYEDAIKIKPLPPDVKALYGTAADQVAKLESARTLFTERKYADALAMLQPLQEQDPQNQNIQKMITDAHFNLGATALQEERTEDAIREFDEVLKANPADELAKRSRDLAARYNGESKDLLYKIYVKYLPMR